MGSLIKVLKIEVCSEFEEMMIHFYDVSPHTIDKSVKFVQDKYFPQNEKGNDSEQHFNIKRPDFYKKRYNERRNERQRDMNNNNTRDNYNSLRGRYFDHQPKRGFYPPLRRDYD
jgi:hypothetical protein